MPRTKAIKTKKSAVSLVTRGHRSKTDMTRLRSGWVASETDSKKKQARHQASLRVRRWSFERTGLGRLGDTENVFTECGVKEGMKHHLRDRNNWNIAAQTRWDPQPAVSTSRSQPGGQELQRVVEKETSGPCSAYRVETLVSVKETSRQLEFWGHWQSRAITIQTASSFGIASKIHFLTANMALTVICLIVMGSCGGTIKRKRQKTQCTWPQKNLGTLWFPHPPVQHQGI